MITIGMPTYNNAQTLERAVTSVLNQTYQDWVIYISDDHSNDATRAVAARMVARDPDRIRLAHADRHLGYMNFRHLLDLCETPYFIWLAGDDWWEPDFLERCFDTLEDHPEAVGCVARCLFHRPDGSSYIDRGTRALQQPRNRRVAKYLLNPDQTRMYGLFRVEALLASFPPQTCHAYDWCLMAGTLARGPHVAVHDVLMNRERTPSEAYIAKVASDEPSRILRFFPVLRMSVIGLRSRIIPATPNIIAALVHINLVKHREQMTARFPTLARVLGPLYRGLLYLTRKMAK